MNVQKSGANLWIRTDELSERESECVLRCLCHSGDAHQPRPTRSHSASDEKPRFTRDTKAKLRSMLTTGGNAFYHVMTQGYNMTTEEATEFALSLF